MYRGTRQGGMKEDRVRKTVLQMARMEKGRLEAERSKKQVTEALRQRKLVYMKE